LTSISEPIGNIPKSDRIVNSYPNPFNSSTTITVNYLEGGDARIRIYDITGRLVKELETTNKEGGEIKAVWDATDNSGRRVSSGIYFARVKSDNYSSIKKLLYLK
ncbi:MAG: T9SS type A sorting domain-containing protein, partial [Candidatus Zixiibacteriota bacterium]